MNIDVINISPEAKPKKRVAAYCRVSTDNDEHENSIENQIRNYEDLIRSNPSYEYAGVYHDFAISGFKEDRPQFQAMIKDALDGKIDLILTKSVSRFARNTKTVLDVTRRLKAVGVGVYFELQKINSLTSEGELMLTIIAAFAQAESDGASELAKMVYKRKYEAGIPVQYLARSFGYRKNEIGEYVIDENEGKWVRKIFQMIVDGHTAASVRRYLNDNGVKTSAGAKWIDTTVHRIIRNEIYKGDFVMHKYFNDEDRKERKNTGQVDSWYVEDDHVPIVSKALWQKAQEALDRNANYRIGDMNVREFTEENYPYKDKLFCAECGHPLYPRAYSNGNRLCWTCSGKVRYGKSFCNGVNVLDSVVQSWNLESNAYVYEKRADKGRREYDYYSESYFKRTRKVKEPDRTVPELNEENYPYLNKVYCGLCGKKLVRWFNTKTKRVSWICSGNKRKGSGFCEGTRIFDDEVRKWLPIDGNIYITARRNNDGKKDYSYTCQFKGGDTK